MVLFGNRCDCCDAAALGLCAACRELLEPPNRPDLTPDLDRVIGLFSYEGTGATLLRRLKFDNRRTSLSLLVDVVLTELIDPIDLVVPVPPAPSHVQERGYDLPDLISRRTSSRLGISRVTALIRDDHGSQRERSQTERASAPAYRATKTVDGSVLLVDDVVTTGSTAKACASALRAVGARSVVLLVLAATPPRTSPRPMFSDRVVNR